MAKFKPKDGKKLWYIYFDNNQATLEKSLRGVSYVTYHQEQHNCFDLTSNCFRTKKEAQAALKKIKEILANK